MKNDRRLLDSQLLQVVHVSPILANDLGGPANGMHPVAGPQILDWHASMAYNLARMRVKTKRTAMASYQHYEHQRSDSFRSRDLTDSPRQ